MPIWGTISASIPLSMNKSERNYLKQKLILDLLKAGVTLETAEEQAEKYLRKLEEEEAKEPPEDKESP